MIYISILYPFPEKIKVEFFFWVLNSKSCHDAISQYLGPLIDSGRGFTIDYAHYDVVLFQDRNGMLTMFSGIFDG